MSPDVCGHYLRIDGEGFVRLAHAEKVIDDLFHSKVQPFLWQQANTGKITDGHDSRRPVTKRVAFNSPKST